MVNIPQNPVIILFAGNAMTMRDGLQMIISNNIHEFFGNKFDLFLMDYPCSGMSHNTSNTMKNVIDSAYDLYSQACASNNGEREIWVLTISIGMAVFASILPSLQSGQEPNGIICVNGLMSMRKTIIKRMYPLGWIYYHGLEGDLNTARLISQYLPRRVQFYWFQADQDEMIDVANVKKVITKWRNDDGKRVFLIMLLDGRHNNFSLYGILLRLSQLRPQGDEFIFNM